MIQVALLFEFPTFDFNLELTLVHTEVRFSSFLSGKFITLIVVNPPEKKLAKRRMISYPDIIISPNPEVKDSVIPRA